MSGYRKFYDGLTSESFSKHKPGLFSCCSDDITQVEHLCFSLVFDDGVLDLQLTDIETKRKWTLAWNEFTTRRNSAAGNFFNQILLAKKRKGEDDLKAAQNQHLQRLAADQERSKQKRQAMRAKYGLGS
eukprot:TRINITY_DN2717_c0_g1_i1.p2 TRINITY_DN2717_c0_g1~~TRINITY_DN2717_c0_g1_i1.p2  ORF type:complete len:129 (-),score=31.22 TRINITY_DN2717_c0_g1_i1:750-1136(-)